MSASTLLGPEIALNRAEEVIETFPARHRWTMSEFQRMAETGFLDPDARLELLEGELFEMAPIGYFHAGMTRILAEKFRMAVGRARHCGLPEPYCTGRLFPAATRSGSAPPTFGLLPEWASPRR
jgi:Uma2 family endonuclease